MGGGRARPWPRADWRQEGTGRDGRLFQGARRRGSEALRREDDRRRRLRRDPAGSVRQLDWPRAAHHGYGPLVRRVEWHPDTGLQRQRRSRGDDRIQRGQGAREEGQRDDSAGSDGGLLAKEV